MSKTLSAKTLPLLLIFVPKRMITLFLAALEEAKSNSLRLRSRLEHRTRKRARLQIHDVVRQAWIVFREFLEFHPLAVEPDCDFVIFFVHGNEDLPALTPLSPSTPESSALADRRQKTLKPYEYLLHRSPFSSKIWLH